MINDKNYIFKEICLLFSVIKWHRSAWRIESFTTLNHLHRDFIERIIFRNKPCSWKKLSDWRTDIYFSRYRDTLDLLLESKNTTQIEIFQIGETFWYPKCCIEFVIKNPSHLLMDESISLWTLDISSAWKYPYYMNPKQPRFIFIRHALCFAQKL